MYSIKQIEYEAAITTYWPSLKPLLERHRKQRNLDYLGANEWKKWLKGRFEAKEPFEFYLVHQEDDLVAFYWLNIWEKIVFWGIEHDRTFENDRLLKLFSKQINKWKNLRPKALFDSKDEFLDQVASESGLNKLNAHEMAQLEVANIDWDLLNTWATDLPTGFSYDFIHESDEELANDIAEIHTILLNDMMGDNKIEPYDVTAEKLMDYWKLDKERGDTYCGLLLRNEVGEAIGYSFVCYKTKEPIIIKQYMTGTIRDYRRKGLGKWLKATMYLHLKNELPNMQYIHTDYFIGNERMRNLNALVGFKKRFVKQKWGLGDVV